MFLLNPGFWVGAIVALASAFFAGKWQEHFATKERLLAAQSRVSVVEKQLTDVSRVLAKDRENEVRRLTSRLGRAIEQLRTRPDRRAEAATPACEGATGRELSRPDGEFLERYAARAESQRAALSECYAWIDKVRAQFEGLK